MKPVLAALTLALASQAAAENLTIETYYPAPSGVYTKMLTTGETYLSRDAGTVMIGTGTARQKLTVNGGVAAASIDFRPYANYPPIGAPPLLPGEAVPAAGRMFYSQEADGYYFASNAAVAGDVSTWYKPVGSGAELVLAAQGTLADSLPASSGWLSPVAASLGASACSQACLRSPVQTSGGLFVAKVSGSYCTAAGNNPGQPVLVLRYRKQGGNWTTLVRQDDDIDVSGSPNCGPVEMEGMFIMGGNIYVDLALRGKRDTSADAVNVTLTLYRLLSF